MSIRDIYNADCAKGYPARPSYPTELGAYLSRLVGGRIGTAWEPGCGGGQATVMLAPYADQIHASDCSQAQLSNAPLLPNVLYRVASDEESGLASNSVSLVAVAQAVHWFNLPAFYAEANRVLQPGGIIAVWCYWLPEVSEEIDNLVSGLYQAETLAPYWPAERGFWESGYKTLPFPFEEEQPPRFSMVHEWRLERFVRYLRTWPAILRCSVDRHANEYVDHVLRNIVDAWERPCSELDGKVRAIQWYLSMRVGRIACA